MKIYGVSVREDGYERSSVVFVCVFACVCLCVCVCVCVCVVVFVFVVPWLFVIIRSGSCEYLNEAW